MARPRSVAFCFGGVLDAPNQQAGRRRDDARRLSAPPRAAPDLRRRARAEDVKIRAGADDDGPLVVQGRDAATGRPRLVTMRAAEVAEAVRPITDEIVRTLAACLDDLPPQALADVLSEGVLVFGGGSLVRGFPEQLERGSRPSGQAGRGALDLRGRRRRPGPAQPPAARRLRPELTVRASAPARWRGCPCGARGSRRRPSATTFFALLPPSPGP